MPTLYLDFETTSGDDKIKAVNPWHHCEVLSFAYAFDDGPVSYIHYLHYSEEDKLKVRQWLQLILDSCDTWVNQNVKFDMHVATNSLGLKLRKEMTYICTIAACKMYDSDWFDYGLDTIAKKLCSYDITGHEKILKRYLRGRCDYRHIPADILEKYTIDDIVACRMVYKKLLELIHPDCLYSWATEKELVYNLYKLEQEGMPVTDESLKLTQFDTINTMCKTQQRLDEILGYTIDPAKGADCFTVLCTNFGLPILAYTEDNRGLPTNNPSFDKAALKKYASYAALNLPLSIRAKVVEVISLISAYRKKNTFNNMFLTPWQGKLHKGRLHPTYNPIVSSGRMSCSDPNAQQLNKDAKRLIVPPEGWSIWSMDMSQIEFRFIVHYINAVEVIKQYQENPDTDFHQWVADMCGMDRDAEAKGVNFGIAFGEGQKKLTAQLSQSKRIIAWAEELAGDDSAMFKLLVTKRAAEVMAKYLATFPTLKPTMKIAANALKTKGYIRNWSGRHRKMPVYVEINGEKRDMTFRAFNQLNQSSAADLFKERINAFCRATEGTEIKPLGVVHDELFGLAPTPIAEDPRMIVDCLSIMETPDKPISVPIRCSYGSSPESWFAASDNAKCRQYEKRTDGTLFDWAKR